MLAVPAIRRPPLFFVLLLAVAVVALGPPLTSSAAEAASPSAEPPSRYPFDPVCPWGRLADGRGMLVRCLGQSEALALAAGSSPSPAAAGAEPVAPASPPDGSTGVAAEDPGAAEPPAPPGRVVVKGVSDAKADTGTLPEAKHQLSRPSDRYVQCVEGHGGLEQPTAQVTVRFLVRERGRAEGVSVQSRKGLSAEAAKCIAGVVDRRYVGFPAAPIVGATLSIELATEEPAPRSGDE